MGGEAGVGGEIDVDGGPWRSNRHCPCDDDHRCESVEAILLVSLLATVIIIEASWSEAIGGVQPPIGRF